MTVNILVLIGEVIILVGFSAICSGLNVGLMSLDLGVLRRKAKLGNKAAKRMLPLRKNSHLTLASILLTNVAAVSTTSLVLEDWFNGIIAGIASTLLIVLFGEILPQAIFTRNAILYMARFAWLLRIMIAVTYPVSKPLQLLLDKLFGKQKTHLQSRHELGILIAEHSQYEGSELDEDEIEIMRGALTLSEKRVRTIMTDIKDVYWLTPDTIIDDEKIDEIKARSMSRIPVFNHSKTEYFGNLLIKDLIDIDFDEHPYAVSELKLYPGKTVGSMTALDTMFRHFISSHTHLMPIERDDKIVGIVTIEDLIEEIIGHEIIDETDLALKRR